MNSYPSSTIYLYYSFLRSEYLHKRCAMVLFEIDSDNFLVNPQKYVLIYIEVFHDRTIIGNYFGVGGSKPSKII